MKNDPTKPKINVKYLQPSEAFLELQEKRRNPVRKQIIYTGEEGEEGEEYIGKGFEDSLAKLKAGSSLPLKSSLKVGGGGIVSGYASPEPALGKMSLSEISTDKSLKPREVKSGWSIKRPSLPQPPTSSMKALQYKELDKFDSSQSKKDKVEESKEDKAEESKIRLKDMEIDHLEACFQKIDLMTKKSHANTNIINVTNLVPFLNNEKIDYGNNTKVGTLKAAIKKTIKDITEEQSEKYSPEVTLESKKKTKTPIETQLKNSPEQSTKNIYTKKFIKDQLDSGGIDDLVTEWNVDRSIKTKSRTAQIELFYKIMHVNKEVTTIEDLKNTAAEIVEEIKSNSPQKAEKPRIQHPMIVS